MYTNLWIKYLPVIRLLLKRSLKEEQVLRLNIPDFERVGIKRKSTLNFLMKLKDGRLRNVMVDLPLASSLATMLLEDAVIRELSAIGEFHISLNTKYELTIKHIPQVDTKLEEATVIETVL